MCHSWFVKSLFIVGLLLAFGLTAQAQPGQPATQAVKATTAAPLYVEGTFNPLSVDLQGNLRTSGGGGGGGDATAANQTSGAQKTQIVSPGGTAAGVTAASTAAVATDTGVVVSLSPNSPIPTGTNAIGSVTLGAALPAGSNSIGNIGTVTTLTTLSTITNPVTITGTVTSTDTQATASSLNMTAHQPTASLLNATVVGGLTNNNAAPTTTNIGALTVLANAAQPTWTEGRQALISVNLKGSARGLICDAALNDRCANVNSSNYLQVVSPPVTYNSTQPTKSNGQADDFQITSRAALIVNPGVEAFGVTLAAETTKVIGTARILGNGGATLDSTVGAGTAPTNQMVAGALYNSTEISPSTGQAFALQADSKGRLRSVLMDAAGNTRGLNIDANSNLGAVLAAGTALVGSVVPYAGGTLVSGAVTTAMTGTTSTSTVSGTASNYLYITNCTVSNASTTVSTDILLQDGSGGTTLYVIPAPAAAVATTGGGGATISFPVPLKVPTSGNALYAANVTTGSSTKISCNGYRSTVSY